jgi:hypothetical protein
VEKLLSHRRVEKHDLPAELQFRVSWSGLPADKATWVPAADLIGCDDLIELYWAQNPAASPDVLPVPTAARRSARIAQRPAPSVSAQICLLTLPSGVLQVVCQPVWHRDGA